MDKGLQCDWDQSMQMVLTPPETGRSNSMDDAASQAEAITVSPVVSGQYEQGLPSPVTSRMTGKHLLPQTIGTCLDSQARRLM